jgi:hypothetical protein
MNQDQLIQLRNQALEQFAQVNADIQELVRRKKLLKSQAELKLDEIKQITTQINQLLQAKTERDVKETVPGLKQESNGAPVSAGKSK